MAGAITLLRRLRAERGAALVVVILVLATSLVFAAAPRLFNRVADAGLRHELARSSPIERSLEFAEAGRRAFGGPFGEGERVLEDDAIGRLTERGEELAGELSPSVADLIGSREELLLGERAMVLEPPKTATFVTLRWQSGIDDQIRLVDGRMPTGTAREGTTDVPGIVTDTGDPLPVSVYEVAVAAGAAEEIGVAVGDRLYLAVEADAAASIPTWFGIDVVGTYQAVDAQSVYWHDDLALQRPEVIGSLAENIVNAAALFAPDAYATLLFDGLVFESRWRFRIDVDRLDAGRLSDFVADMRRLSVAFPAVAPATGAEPVTTLRTGLTRIVDRYQAQRISTESVLAVATIGPAAVAVGTVGLMALLIVGRRRPVLLLARARGATGAQLLTGQLAEAVLLVAPAAAAGYLAALLLVDARSSEWSLFAAVAVAGAAAALLLGATLPLARARPVPQERDEAVVGRVHPRRLVLEGGAIALAVVGAALIRERGVSGQGAGGQLVAVDPLLAGAPVLVGMAAGLGVLRLYPLPLRLIGWLASLRRDLVPVIALRRAARQPASSHLPLLVLMVTVAIGAFSSVMVITIDRGQLDTAWREIGADHRVVPALPGLAPGEPPGVEAVAAAARVEASLSTPRTAGTRIELHAIDAADYAGVIAGTPLDGMLPAALLAAPGEGLGSASNPLPAVVSRQMPAGTAPLRPGDTFDLRVIGRLATFRVVEVRDELPSLLAGARFVLTSRDLLTAALPDRRLPDAMLLVRAPGLDAADIRTAAADGAGSVEVQSRAARHAELRDAPLVSAVGAGFALAALAAAAYAALAVGTALAIGSAARSRELAQLRTLGLTKRGVVWITIVEQAPALVVAVVAGTALGIGVAWLVEPALRLEAFVGGGAVTLRIDPLAAGGIGLALVVVAAVGVAVASVLARRMAPAIAIRQAQE